MAQWAQKNPEWFYNWVCAMVAALSACATSVPSTKGLGPKDRADRLHAEMERRIRIASDAKRFDNPGFAPKETP
jgi:hypothetical protein